MCGTSLVADINEFFWRRTANRGFHEEDTENFLVSVVKPGNTVLDVGARVGIYTVLSGILVGNSGQVFGFEPDPRNFAALCKSVKLNKLKNVSISRVALGENNVSSANFNVFAESGTPPGMGHVTQSQHHAGTEAVDSF